MSWNLECRWCDYFIVVGPGGGHGKSQGNGFDAAEMMQKHVALHDKTWNDFLWEVEST